jgi:hypothetical protein
VRLATVAAAGVAVLSITSPGVATGASSAAATDQAASHGAHPPLAKTTRKVSIRADHNVTEGHRYHVKIRLAKARGVSRVQVLQQQTDVLGDTSWEVAKTLHPHGHHRLRTRLVPIQANTQRTRAKVIYKSGERARSNTARTTVWSWTPLTSFRPYYATTGTSPYIPYAIDGTEYPPGWTTYETEPSWETRHTLGHHCKAFKGTTGLTDSSADGSSATITITANGTDNLYTSPTLTPGMAKPFHFSMSRIYRLWITATNTGSDAGTTLATKTYPAIGDPELLCTGM